MIKTLTFFPLRCFLSLINLMSMNFKLINLMSMNFKLINLMSMNFVNKQISYFFPLRCFLSLINLMSMNFKLINLMSMNFKLINFKLVVFLYFLVLFSAFWCLVFFLCFFVFVKSDHKKNKKV